MNYLAHIFLSGNDRCIQIGNFIGDGVKGDGYKQYPRKFQEFCYTAKSMLSRTGIRWSGKP